MKIKSDHYKPYKEKMEEISKDMKGMGFGVPDCEPADLYGKRVNLDQNDKSNLGETAEDIQEFYGLCDYNGNSKKMGGVSESNDESY